MVVNERIAQGPYRVAVYEYRLGSALSALPGKRSDHVPHVAELFSPVLI